MIAFLLPTSRLTVASEEMVGIQTQLLTYAIMSVHAFIF